MKRLIGAIVKRDQQLQIEAMVMISNLREHTEFLDIVAQRCWTAWWMEGAVSLEEYRGWVAACVASTTVPSCLVAHVGKEFRGAVSLIASDMNKRPQYTPWIAALWVEEGYRRQGTAVALIDSARKEAKRCGYEKAYLCATEANSPYYRARGFTQIESDVEGLNVFEIGVSQAPCTPSQNSL
jgi:GNAT superfamily N-acetyltransferase